MDDSVESDDAVIVEIEKSKFSLLGAINQQRKRKIEKRQQGYRQEDELAMYLSESISDADEDDCFRWWKANSTRFPKLGKLARKYLCIQASNTATERLGSTSSGVISRKRYSLKQDASSKQNEISNF